METIILNNSQKAEKNTIKPTTHTSLGPAKAISEQEDRHECRACPHCGAVNDTPTFHCAECGAYLTLTLSPPKTIEPETISQIHDAKPGTMHFLAIVFLSILLLLSLLYIPLYTGSFFPESEQFGKGCLIDAIEVFAKNKLDPETVLFPRTLLFSAFFGFIMLIFAICKSKIASVISAAAGTGVMAWYIIEICNKLSEHLDLYREFDSNYSMLTIGVWINICLFIACLITALKAP